MDEYAKLREMMVAAQLIPRGIKDKRVLEAMRKVPRHLFMPGSFGESLMTTMHCL